MQLTFTKRSNHGLSFLTSYTFSKSLATTDTAGPGDYTYNAQNIYNIASDYSVTAFHSPHDLKVTWIYDLPFGKQGKWMRSGIGNIILGGWSASMIHRYQTGAPISVSTSNYDALSLFNRNLRPDVILPPEQQTVGGSFTDIDVTRGTPYLNPAAFKTPELTSKRVPTHMGTAPRFLPNVRGFSRYGEDFSFIKKTDLGFREGAFFEIRIDALNVFNRIGLGGPITDVGNANFGKSLQQSRNPAHDADWRPHRRSDQVEFDLNNLSPGRNSLPGLFFAVRVRRAFRRTVSPLRQMPMVVQKLNPPF